MLWLIFTIVAYFFFALASLNDRYLLAGPLPKPLVYTFYVSIAGIFVTFLMPFGFLLPSVSFIFLSLGTGIFSVVGLYMLFHTVFHGNVSRVVPMVGTLLPIFTLILIFGLTGGEEVLPPRAAPAFLLFVIATLLLSLDFKTKRFFPSATDLVHVVITSFVFALTFVLTKVVYEELSFVNGFIWMRWGAFLAAVSLLIIPDVRRTVFKLNPLRRRRVYLPLLMGNGSGAIGFFLQQYAVSLAQFSQVALINALQGVQYIFLLIFVMILGLRKPKLLHEELTRTSFIFRILGVILVVTALYLLFH